MNDPFSIPKVGAFPAEYKPHRDPAKGSAAEKKKTGRKPEDVADDDSGTPQEDAATAGPDHLGKQIDMEV